MTHDLTSATGAAAAHAYTSNDDALLRQTLREIERTSTFDAAQRRLPYETATQYLQQSKLDWEYDETRGFLNRQLSADPRLQPNDIEVDASHMHACTSCTHDEGLHNSLHGAGSSGEATTVSSSIDVDGRTQLLVDDWAVHTWQNVVRFLEPPTSRRTISLDDHNDVRFGCPCSVSETADKQVRLSYQSGPSIFGAPDGSLDEDLNGRYSWRLSTNGVDGWTNERGPISVNRRGHLGTLTIASGISPAKGTLPNRRSSGNDGLHSVAGYEGRRGRACIASSSNGADFYNIENEADRRKPGLNDDCLSAPGVQGSNSVLARAADSYIDVLVDWKRQRELIWYRKGEPRTS